MDQHFFEEYHNSLEVGICVVKRRNESMNDLIRRFKKKYSKSGLNKEVRDLLAFDKPCIKKTKKSAAAKRARIRDAQKNNKQVDKTKKSKKRKEY